MTPERIARLLHAGQWYVEDVVPYINHIRDVVDAVGGADKGVAWLHDVLEDTDITVTELLDLGVSHEVVEAVIVLTRCRDETYGDYIERVSKSCNPAAIRVKVADLRSNLKRCRGDSKSYAYRTLIKRYQKSLEKLEELI